MTAIHWLAKALTLLPEENVVPASAISDTDPLRAHEVFEIQDEPNACWNRPWLTVLIVPSRSIVPALPLNTCSCSKTAPANSVRSESPQRLQVDEFEG